MELYHAALADYSLEQIRSACTQHIKKSKWFPKINELIEHLAQHVPQITSRAEDQASIVLATIRNYGYSHSPVWEDPITRHLFSRRFNFRSLCETLMEDETKWFVKEFKEAYQAANDMCDGDTKQLEAPPELLKLASGLFKSIN